MKITRKLSFIIIILLSFTIQSCLKSTRDGIPDGVRKTLAVSGINQPNLMQAIAYYYHPSDSMKLKAMYWLVKNMRGNYSAFYSVKDSMGKQFSFPPDHYKDYFQMERSWDSVERIYGPLTYKADSFLLDPKHINSSFLINTIESSFNSHKKYIWSRQYNYNQFFKWIIPYRCANEQVEPFRDHFLKKYGKYLSTNDSLSIIEAAFKLNNIINKEFSYSDSYNKEANVQTISQLEKSHKGNFYDLNIYKIKALRSFGIAAALDYSPFLADTAFGYAWTTIILPDNSELRLEFKQKVKNLYKPGRLAKIYRRVFYRDTTSLYVIKKPGEPTPPFMGQFFYIDITEPAFSRPLLLPYYADTDFAYLSVFNMGEWHPISWSIPHKSVGTDFLKMGTNIIYLPVKQEKNHLFRLGDPIFLSEDGNYHYLSPDFSIEIPAILKKLSPNLDLNPGIKYNLYLWKGNWDFLFSFTGRKKGKIVPLPANALFLITDHDYLTNERIFLIDNSGNQLFY